MTLTYTPRLKLAVPDFLTEPWHSEFEQAMQSIDRAVYNAILVQSAALWMNSTDYVIGDLIISPDNGAMYTCGVAHTSAAAGTFTSDLAAHPTFWTTFAPSLATQLEAEAGVENTKYMSALRTSQAIAALSSATSLDNPRCGVLQYVNATTLIFKPKFGDRIRINGIIQPIPAAGINILNTGLADDTTYLIFAFINAGVLASEIRAVTAGPTTHAPSVAAGNVGTEIAVVGGVPDETRSLIGIVHTSNPTHIFVDTIARRFVRSWFNDVGKGTLAQFTANRTTTSTATPPAAELNAEIRNQIVLWEGEHWHLIWSGNVINSVFDDLYCGISLDGGAVLNSVNLNVDPTAIGRVAMTASYTFTPTEGFHYATIMGAVDSGTGSWVVNADSRTNTLTGISIRAGG